MKKIFAFKKEKFAGIFEIDMDIKEWKTNFCFNNGFKFDEVKLFEISDENMVKAEKCMNHKSYSRVMVEKNKLAFVSTIDMSDKGIKKDVILDKIPAIAIH